MLHIHLKDKGAEKNQAVTDTDTTVSSALVAVQTSGLTGAGEHDCKLSIVPVKVKSKKGHKIVEAYAFLDQESSASFCTMTFDEWAGYLRKRNQDFLVHKGPRKSCGKLHCIGFGGSWPGQGPLL